MHHRSLGTTDDACATRYETLDIILSFSATDDFGSVDCLVSSVVSVIYTWSVGGTEVSQPPGRGRQNRR